jgi:hypothetical protein
MRGLDQVERHKLNGRFNVRPSALALRFTVLTAVTPKSFCDSISGPFTSKISTGPANCLSSSSKSTGSGSVSWRLTKFKTRVPLSHAAELSR